MLTYSEILAKKFIVYEGAPYEVLDAHIFRMQQRKPVNQTKLKNLLTNKVNEVTFHQADKVNEAEIDTREIKYLYTNKGQYWFCEVKDPSKRFQLEEGIVGVGGRFLKPNSLIEVLTWLAPGQDPNPSDGQGKIIGIRLPIKVELKVTDAPPAVKGNTAQGATKQITLETGATVNAPMFISEGEMVKINTVTGEYVERA